LDSAARRHIERDPFWTTDFFGAVLAAHKRAAAKGTVFRDGVPSALNAPTVGFIFSNMPGNVVGQAAVLPIDGRVKRVACPFSLSSAMAIGMRDMRARWHRITSASLLT
jgi:hypothetical protein